MSLKSKNKMNVEYKRQMTETVISKDDEGKVLSVIETKYTNYNYFTLPIGAKLNDKGELKKIMSFPKDWTNITKKYNPKHNGIALICGQKSGIYVVDYDTQEQFLKDSVKFPELKNHYLKTRKGFHSYFKWDNNVQTKIGSTSIKEHDIDFQGEKKCVLTEPTSYHDEDGNKYKYQYVREEPLKNMSDDLINYYLTNYFKSESKVTTVSVPTVSVPTVSVPVSDSQSQPDIAPLLNGMLNTDYNWNCEKLTEDSFKLTHDSLNCVKEDGTTHSSLNHSCVFINKRVATAFCFSCKSKKLLVRDYPQLKEIKKSLGLIQEKKSSDEDNNDFESLMYYMLERSEEMMFKKENGWILKPVEGVPTFYDDHMEYSDYLDDLFQDKELATYKIFRKRVTHKHQLIDYLKTYNDKELPFIKRDPYIYSFNNGYLDIRNMEFKEYEDTTYNFCTAVYIKQDFNKSLLDIPYDKIETPNFDKLMKYHIKDDDAYDVILGLIGRLFFEVREKDNWQCMMFIKGQANTGKSTFIEIIEHLFNQKDIGVIGQTLEKTFGLQNLWNKRLIVSSDIPNKISEKLDATMLQKMVSGEKVPIAVKNGEAKYVDWKPTMLWAGNFLPDYSDKSGSVSRRLAIIDMGKKVVSKDAGLKNRILETEIISLLIKFIKAYLFFLDKFGNTVFEDWGKKFGIKYFDKAREEFKQENDILYAFLTAPPNSNKTKSSNIWIEYKEGSITPLETFKKRFKAYACFKHEIKGYKWSNTSDNSTLESLGYEIVTVNICASCGKKGQKGCCDNYSAGNRRKKVVVNNMLIRDGFDEGIDFSEPDI